MRTIILVSLLLLQFPFQAQFWIQKASVGGVGRHRATGCATSHRGYIGLGHINGTGQDITFKDWWEYDPAADTWTQKADFPIATHGAVAFIADNCPVVGGGSALSTQSTNSILRTTLGRKLPIVYYLILAIAKDSRLTIEDLSTKQISWPSTTQIPIAGLCVQLRRPHLVAGPALL